MKKSLILLVEDNPGDVILTQRAFKKSNVINTMVVASDGQEALDFLFCTGKYAGRDPREMPVVILLDLKLPKIDGMEVLQNIRADARTRLLPVVILTSSSEEKDIIRSYQLGANSYIRKPVNFDHFVDVAKQISVYWLLLNEVILPTT